MVTTCKANYPCPQFAVNTLKPSKDLPLFVVTPLDHVNNMGVLSAAVKMRVRIEELVVEQIEARRIGISIGI